jgi:hypothetical protein
MRLKFHTKCFDPIHDHLQVVTQTLIITVLLFTMRQQLFGICNNKFYSKYIEVKYSEVFKKCNICGINMSKVLAFWYIHLNILSLFVDIFLLYILKYYSVYEHNMLSSMW